MTNESKIEGQNKQPTRIRMLVFVLVLLVSIALIALPSLIVSHDANTVENKALDTLETIVAAFENYMFLYVIVFIILLFVKPWLAIYNIKGCYIFLSNIFVSAIILLLLAFSGGIFRLDIHDYIYMACVLFCISFLVFLFDFTEIETYQILLDWYRLIFEIILISLLPAIAFVFLSASALLEIGPHRIFVPFFAGLDWLAMLAAGFGVIYVYASSMMSLGLLFDGWSLEDDYFGPLPEGLKGLPGFSFEEGKKYKLISFIVIVFMPLAAIWKYNFSDTILDWRDLCTLLGLIAGLGFGGLFYILACAKNGDNKYRCYHNFLHKNIVEFAFNLVRNSKIKIGDNEVGQRIRNHTSALIYFISCFLISFLIGLLLFLIGWDGFALAGICLLLGNLAWLLGFLNFHFRRMNVSIFGLILIILFVGFFVPSPNYLSIFKSESQNVNAQSNAQTEQKKQLPASVFCEVNKNKCEMIVVSGSGGGMQASVWFLEVLNKLNLDLSRVGVWSTVSGSSVGLAHYLAQLHYEKPLNKAIEAANQPSIDPVILAYKSGDFWGSLSMLRTIGLDRGALLEWKWCMNSYKTAKESITCTPYRKSDEAEKRRHLISNIEKSLREHSSKGLDPIVIMNATLLETGERIKMEFSSRREMVVRHKDETRRLRDIFDQSESLITKSSTLARNYDADIWTIARASATFPYISPAAKPRGKPRFHLIDGGYIENFGTISAIEHIRKVLRSRELQKENNASKCEKDVHLCLWLSTNVNINIRLLEIFVEPKEQDQKLRSVSWLQSALLGPLYGVSKGMFLRQRERVDNALRALKYEVKDQKNISIESEKFGLESAGSLNWRLRKNDEREREKNLGKLMEDNNKKSFITQLPKNDKQNVGENIRRQSKSSEHALVK